MYTADETVLENLNFQTIRPFLERHKCEVPRLNKLRDYYLGKHDILTRTREGNAPNNKIVCNHAKEIVDTSAGYFIGNPVSYNGKNAEMLKEWMRIADIDSVDMDIAKSEGIYGRAYELVSMSDDDSPTPRSYKLDPRNAFIVYDDTVEHKKLFGVYYFPQEDATGNLIGFWVNVYTDAYHLIYHTDGNMCAVKKTSQEPNPFSEVALIEYSNNEEQQGDFEQVIPLIDAYNLLMSDRVNDKEEFVDAILLLINAVLGDTPEEESATAQAIKKDKILELPSESDARYLVRTFDEAGVEILKKALEQDIHKFANVPCLSDENFVGNASGVAMEYKLLGLEMITKIKERYFKAGLSQRLKLYGTICTIKGGTDDFDVEPVFSRGLPKNLVETANIITQLQDMVPAETLLALLPFIKDAKAAAEEMENKNREKAEEQKKAYGIVDNNAPPAGDIDE